MKLNAPVLVLGATGGVGLVTARLLHESGHEVIAGCRTAEQGKALMHANVCSATLRLSLDRPRSIDAAFAQLQQRGVNALAGVVNCAAITWPKPLELSTMAEVRQSFEVNLFGALHVIQLALPLLRPMQGRIVLVSSTSGSLGVPLLGAYSASKFALEGAADVLRRELTPWKIGVSLVVPGGIKTAMIDRQLAEIDSTLKRLGQSGIEAIYAKQYRQHRWLIETADKTAVTPEQVASDVRRALTEKRPKARYLCGATSNATRVLTRTLGDSTLDKIFDWLPEQARRGD